MAYVPSSDVPSAFLISSDADAVLLDLQGTFVLLDGGSEKVLFTKHVRQIDANVISAPTKAALTNAVELNKETVVPLVGNIPTVKSAGSDGSVASLLKRIEQASEGRPVITQTRFNPKYEPIVISKSLRSGRLELTVLAGDPKEVEALVRAVESGDEHMIEKAASTHGTISVLVWFPARPSDPIKRILHTGTASFGRIMTALEKAKALPFLHSHVVSAANAFKDVPPPAKNSNSRGTVSSRVTSAGAKTNSTAAKLAPPRRPLAPNTHAPPSRTTVPPANKSAPASAKPSPARPSAAPAPSIRTRTVPSSAPTRHAAPTNKTGTPANNKKPAAHEAPIQKTTVAPVKGAAMSRVSATNGKAAGPAAGKTSGRVPSKDTPSKTNRSAPPVPSHAPAHEEVKEPAPTPVEPVPPHVLPSDDDKQAIGDLPSPVAAGAVPLSQHESGEGHEHHKEHGAHADHKGASEPTAPSPQIIASGPAVPSAPPEAIDEAQSSHPGSNDLPAKPGTPAKSEPFEPGVPADKIEPAEPGGCADKSEHLEHPAEADHSKRSPPSDDHKPEPLEPCTGGHKTEPVEPPTGNHKPQPSESHADDHWSEPMKPSAGDHKPEPSEAPADDDISEPVLPSAPPLIPTPDPVSSPAPGPNTEPTSKPEAPSGYIEIPKNDDHNAGPASPPKSPQSHDDSLPHVDITPAAPFVAPSINREGQASPSDLLMDDVPDEFKGPHTPQEVGENGLLDDLEEPPKLKKISMDTDEELKKALEKGATAVADQLAQCLDELTLSNNNSDNEDSSKKEVNEDESSKKESDNPAELARKLSRQMIEEASTPLASALASALADGAGAVQTAVGSAYEGLIDLASTVSETVTEGVKDAAELAQDKMKAMQTRSSLVENDGNDRPVKYEETDPVIDSVLETVATDSDRVDHALSNGGSDLENKENGRKPEHEVDEDGFRLASNDHDIRLHLPPLTAGRGNRAAPVPHLSRPLFFELVTVPHLNGKCTLTDEQSAIEYFTNVRSANYILHSEDVSPAVLDGWLTGKKQWFCDDQKCRLIPTRHHSALLAFVTAHSAEMEEHGLVVNSSLEHNSISINTEEGREDYHMIKIEL